MNSDDANHELARTDQLTQTVERIASALDRFSRFEGDDSARRRSEWQPVFDEDLPAHGAGADAVLDLLCEHVIGHGLRTGAPGFCGWVTTAPASVPAAAQLAASVAAAQRWWVHPGNFLELLALRWVCQLLELPDSWGGAFVSGGAAANLLGLGAARQRAGERAGIDPNVDGVSALDRPRIYAPESVHRVVTRAASILGLGRGCVQLIASGRDRRVDVDALERAIDADVSAGCTPVAVVASAGDVNRGWIDPLDAMGRIARDRGVWFHVDGAYGGFGYLDPRVREAFGELDRADSLAVDPHKWLAAPVGCGAGLVRDPAILERAFAIDKADYARVERRSDGDPDSSFDLLGDGTPDSTIEHSAPSRGVVVWALLKEIGASGVARRVARHLDCARRVAERVGEHEDLELLSAPELSICCFRYHPPAIRDSGTLERLNAGLMKDVRARGRSVPSTTRIDNKLAIRPCFIGPRTTIADADTLVDEVLAAGAARVNDIGDRDQDS